MTEFMPFIAFGVALAAYIAWLMLRDRTSNKAHAQKLARLGFTPCPDEAETLAEKVTRLENNAGYNYIIKDPMRASLGEKTVYFYTKSLRRYRKTVAETSEFLVPLERPSAGGLLMFIKPSNLPTGAATKFIGALAAGPWDAHPDDLVKLEVSIDIQAPNLLSVLAPAGASLYDLVDAKTLAAMQQLGDCGILIVMCRDSWCSLNGPSGRLPLNMERLWPIIRQLA
ncbi:MAG: hypothetical protein V3S46_03185 [Nitrospinota bacterium]